jgi:lipopolysaccharide transport system permease protein
MSPGAIPYRRIVPTRGWAGVEWGEVWEYRELLYFLAWRDVKVRYKQTLLGAAWAVLVPLLTMVVFNVLFGLLMGQEGKPTVEGVPYALSTFAALVPWQLFANALTQSASSLVVNRNIITKVYFPRIIVPMAPVASSLVDFSIALGVLALLIAGYDLLTGYAFAASARLFALPLFTLLAVVTALAFSLWLSALNAIYRDFRYVIPFVVQMLMFVSPVVYTSEGIVASGAPGWVASLYFLNPLAGVLEGFRWALFGRPELPLAHLLLTGLAVTLLLAGAAYYFRRMERLVADLG